MIFTKKFNKHGDIKWKRKFAFLPLVIKQDKEKGIETLIWLEFYEEKYICFSGEWWRTKEFKRK